MSSGKWVALRTKRPVCRPTQARARRSYPPLRVPIFSHLLLAHGLVRLPVRDLVLLAAVADLAAAGADLGTRQLATAHGTRTLRHSRRRRERGGEEGRRGRCYATVVAVRWCVCGACVCGWCARCRACRRLVPSSSCGCASGIAAVKHARRPACTDGRGFDCAARRHRSLRQTLSRFRAYGRYYTHCSHAHVTNHCIDLREMTPLVASSPMVLFSRPTPIPESMPRNRYTRSHDTNR